MLLVFGLNLLAFTALCLAMNRHHKNLLGHEPSAPRVLLLRGVALLDLGLALAFSIHRQGVGIGIVFWSCLLMLAAGTLVLLLAWRPRWALPCAAGVPLLGGVLALLR
ncbi:DUF3325 domain-containing protein [Pseudomonas aeruginosa]|uniref:DUF3325 domain-containing protein n=1 Tax=Pseudomonas aeruginosa TaxID=287 RepID=UPI0015F07B84|nr:DUF3325 domain-containing protein [Pseudomonas aeruginosa]MBA4868081.1 DUF3325 domain-containing protein [Pseudomonas aeruginosa]MBA4984754.1 DUF3325 domain-containing protein [Pseudomonas aeruginosa]MDI2156264.1 DUF3325 domain-containing protein [Pseudomonas aeruginosa]MDI2205831.1 DUF3325 domain-containing protein [Pseudomonas aeruginosa]MDI3693428.1 DUF3325 domain-containing protein [Pseudomonas aeruginosa]